MGAGSDPGPDEEVTSPAGALEWMERRRMMTETEKAMTYDMEMEKKYKASEPIERCLEIAASFLGVSETSVYVVMFSFVLGGYKAFCSSNEIHDDHSHYVEVIYNDRKDEFYAIHYEETERETI